jgi:hypothetical protein
MRPADSLRTDLTHISTMLPIIAWSRASTRVPCSQLCNVGGESGFSPPPPRRTPVPPRRLPTRGDQAAPSPRSLQPPLGAPPSLAAVATERCPRGAVAGPAVAIPSSTRRKVARPGRVDLATVHQDRWCSGEARIVGGTMALLLGSDGAMASILASGTLQAQIWAL